MPAAVTKGIVVSFGNTPQAVNDVFSGLVDENSTGTVLLNVMANDEGGNAKTLWSIDDGISAGGIRPTDLLTQDVAGVFETSALGAKIWITGGKIGYQLTTALSSSLQHLGEGATVSDTITYAIKLGNGTLSWATAAVTIAGKNDQASISGTSSGSVTEDDDTSASGTLTVSDIDDGEAHSKAASGDGDNELGTYEVDADGNWTYTVDNAAIQHLGATGVLTDSFTVESADGSATKEVTVTIHGKNDDASISGTDTGDVTEDDDTSASGTLTVSDVDDGEAHSKAASGDGDNDLGTYEVDADGNWTYTVDNAEIQHLGATGVLTDSFTVESADGTATKEVTVTIHGKNDDASISGTDSGDVTEDDDTSASGTLTVSDIDDGEAHSKAASGDGDNELGTYEVDADGNWTYTVDNAAIQHLGATGVLTDSFTVESADGSATKEVTVTIHGKNDDASISGTDTGDVTEDGTLTAQGNLSVSDVDDNEAAATAASGSGNNNYGSYAVDANGHWSYTLNNGLKAVQDLNDGQTLTDSFTVWSADHSDSQLVTVTIHGKNDGPSLPPTFTGPDPNDFDANGNPAGDNWSLSAKNNPGPYGGGGDDHIQGTNDDNTIYGGSGNDEINGNSNNDVIYGGSGDDKLTGGQDTDVVIGGYGADTITSTTTDTIRYLSVLDTNDTIINFVSGGSNKIDLSTIDANTSTGANDMFLWGGQKTGPAVVANSVTWYTDGVDTYVLADTNGDIGNAEFAIKLAGITSITSNDFNTL